MPRKVFAALIHYPIIDKHGVLVSTSITNLDIHDISRSARTYGIAGYYLVTPIEAQHWLVQRVLEHWEHGWGATYNANRSDALNITNVVSDIEQLRQLVFEQSGQDPVWIATSARNYPNSSCFSKVRLMLAEEGPPICLLFGTGWGLHPELLMEADYILEPIRGSSEFNHLSVRSAAAIVFDRLLRP